MSTVTSVPFRIPPCHFATHAGIWRLLAVLSEHTRVIEVGCGVFLRIITWFRAALAVSADWATRRQKFQKFGIFCDTVRDFPLLPSAGKGFPTLCCCLARFGAVSGRNTLY